jgi:ferric enterobactin receptor
MKYLLYLLIFAFTTNLIAQTPDRPARDGRREERTGGGDSKRTERGDNQGRPNGESRPNMPLKPTGTAQITGFVQDSTSQQPVEFANITLINQVTGKITDGAVANDKGKFTMNELPEGNYKLQVTFLGYNNQFVENINLIKDQKKELGILKIAPNDQVLEEVTVVTQRSMVEEKVDRLIYNAEKDITTRGGDAADVLRKVPMLSVDLDGNVSLRGNQNIKVLINNKPSTIMASSIADALKQIPADMIKTVEVITSPSAKYDAEGSSGIINIITKKVTIEGYTLNVDMGAGNRSSNLGLNGNYRKGDMGFSLGGHGRGMYNQSDFEINQSTRLPNKSTTTKQDMVSRDQGIFGHYNLGWDYDFAKNQSLSAGARFGVRSFKKQQNQLTNLIENSLSIPFQERDVNSKDVSNSWDVNLDYLHTFAKPQREWSISTQYSRNDLNNSFDANLLNTDHVISTRQKNLNVNLNQEVTFQSDYQTPIKDNQMLEFGGKGIFRLVNSDFEYQKADDASSPYRLDTGRPSGNLDYSQNVGAAYTSYSIVTPKKYTFKVGTRYEFTEISANQGNRDFEVKDYGLWVPSINFSKAIKEGTTLKMGYNRRIQRPGLQQLNPNFNAANPQIISVGNPNLEPELTNNGEISISTFFKNTYLNVALFGRSTNNAISQVRQPNDTLVGAVISTFQNIGKQKALGTNIFGNVTLTKNWTINGNAEVMYVFLEGFTAGINGLSQKINNTGFNLGGRISSDIKFKKGWSASSFAMLRNVQVQLQGKRGGFYMYSVGIKKDFKNKKGSIGLAGENFLNQGTRIRNEFDSPTFTQIEVEQKFNTGVKLTLNYRFGKMKMEEKRKKTKSVNNDDLKDSGGGNDGGGQQGGQPNSGRRGKQ